MSHSNIERSIIERYDDMLKRVHNERHQLSELREKFLTLIADYPGVDEYYAVLKIIGGRDAWLAGKGVEITAMKKREQAKDKNPSIGLDKWRSEGGLASDDIHFPEFDDDAEN